MGLLRKTLFIGTGGLGPNWNSNKERTRKAAEKSARIQGQMLKQQQSAAVPRVNVNCPKCHAALVSPVGDNIKCPFCGFRMRVWQTTPAPAPSQPQSPPNTTSELERLAALHASGGLTDGEFAAAKAKILGS